MKKLYEPKGLVINFQPSEKQMEVWNAISPNRCDKCGGKLEMRFTGRDEKGNPIYEPTCVDCGNTDIPERVLEGGAGGGGKALWINDLVLTPNGFKRMWNVRVGNEVCTASGRIARVIATHPQGEKQLWEITTNDGVSVRCCDDHIWYINGLGLINTKRMRELFGKTELSMPFCSPQTTKFVEYDSFLHPYIIGVLMAKRCLRRRSVLFMDDFRIIERMRRVLDADFILDNLFRSKNRYVFIDLFRTEETYWRFQDEVDKLRLNGGRASQVPDFILYGSVETRIEFLKGLLDNGGGIDENGYCSLKFFVRKFAEQVVELVRSLGWMCKYEIIKVPNKNGIMYSWHILTINTEDNSQLFFDEKKEKAKAVQPPFERKIVSIKDAGIRKAKCITIDDPSGMFITNGYLPTHNSYLGSCWLIISCIRFPGILMVVARLTLKDLRATTWATILRVLKSWGLEENVNYRVNNQYGYLEFWNGSTIMMYELSPSLKDPEYNNLGSLEITGAFIDEVSEVPEKAVEVLGSRIRFMVAETFVVGKLLMSTNPVQNYVKTTFVSDDDGLPVKLQKGDRFIPFTVFDNPDVEFRNTYFNKLRKIKDKVTRERIAYGNWDYTETNKMSAYWNFDGEKSIVSNLFEKSYDPLRPLILSFDFNVSPYMTCLPIQIDYEKKEFYVFPEFIGRPIDKLNNTPAFTRHIKKKLTEEWCHSGGVLITGDPAGLARSTQTEEGVNNFTIANKNLNTSNLRPKIQLLHKQPAIVTRLEFINELFSGYNGWKVFIDLRCRRLTEDFIYQRKNEDGTKEKKKVDDGHGGKAEKYGHASDCFDYAVIYYLAKEYEKYRNGAVEAVTTVPYGTVVYGSFDY